MMFFRSFLGVLFPDPKITRHHKSWFTLPGYDGENTDHLTYVNLINPTYVEKGAELRVWFTQDLLDFAESDNAGKHCVDVYARITDRF